jgi:DNA-binding transcriptional MerR regulator
VKVKEEITKLYYTIGEVAQMFGVSSSLIRYWESEFATLKPKKNRKGDRRFTKKDIILLEKIYTLVKERGFTLDGAKKELRKKNSIDKNQVVISRLMEIKGGLKNLRDKL